MYLQTMLELSHMTDNIRFEWMMTDLLSSYKYKGIDPQSPGMKDRGKDAVYYDENNAVVFAFSIQKTWKSKFHKDFASAVRNNLIFRTFVFCSNQVLPATERDEIIAEKAAQGIEVDFYGAERIKVLLDTHYKKIRQIYLGIQDNTTVRKKIRNTLFDPDNEVQSPERWRMLGLVASRAMIGLFNLIKEEDLTMICETQQELDTLNTFIDIFMRLRRLATIIDNQIFLTLVDMVETNMPYYYQKVGEYIKLRLLEEDKRAVEKRINVAGYLNPTNEYCEKCYEDLQKDQELKGLIDNLEATKQECLKAETSILALKGFQFGN